MKKGVKVNEKSDPTEKAEQEGAETIPCKAAWIVERPLTGYTCGAQQKGV